MAFWSKASAQKPSVSIASDSDSESQSLVATPPPVIGVGFGNPDCFDGDDRNLRVWTTTTARKPCILLQ